MDWRICPVFPVLSRLCLSCPSVVVKVMVGYIILDTYGGWVAHYTGGFLRQVWLLTSAQSGHVCGGLRTRCWYFFPMRLTSLLSLFVDTEDTMPLTHSLGLCLGWRERCTLCVLLWWFTDLTYPVVLESTWHG